MTTVHRVATRRRAAALAASLALAAGVVGTLAGPASAEEPDGTAQFLDHQNALAWDVAGRYPGQTEDLPVYQTGLNIIQITGEDGTSLAYCVQPHEDIVNQGTGGYPLSETDWASSSIRNHDIVADIMANYFPIADGPEGYTLTGRDQEKAAATQAAIWHFTDDFLLSPDNAKHDEATVFANYTTILKAVEDGVLHTHPHLTLTIDAPEHGTALVNELVGPFTVQTTAASVDLMPGEGLTVHHEDGTPFEGPAHDGDELWLTSATAGHFTLAAKASGLESGVRYFMNKGLQDFAFAVITPKEVTAEVPVDFTTPPETTIPPATAPPTTAPPQTTVPVTPETTVVTTPEASTTTAPEQGGGLPVTGAQSLLLAGLAVALIAVGVTFGVLSRRRRGES